RRHGAGGEPTPEPVRADAKDDEDGGQGQPREDDARVQGRLAGHALDQYRENRMRKAVLALCAAWVALMPMAPALAQPEARIKGADIMKHPIGPLALQYVDLVQAGRMEDALKLAHNKAQAEWKKYPGERKSYTDFMKKMMPSRADLEKSLQGSAILVIEGQRATLNSIKT